jgi:hypothetical protein
MGHTANSLAVAILLLGGACSADGSREPAVLRAEVPKRPHPPSSASAPAPAASESPAREQPQRIEMVVTDRDGKYDDFARLFPNGVPFEGCLDKSAVGDRGSLFVTIGGEGRPNPEIEHEGLSGPLLRCLMEEIVEAQAQSGTSIEHFIYVSVE